MSKKLDKLIDEICSEVEKTVGHRKYVETFLQGIDFNSVDEGIIDEDYYYASDRLDDVFYYYEESLNNDEYYERYGDIFTDKVVKLLNELKKELSKFTESKKENKKSLKESNLPNKIYEGRKVDTFIIYYEERNGETDGYEVNGVKELKNALKWLHSDEIDVVKITVYKRGKDFDNNHDDVTEYYFWTESKKPSKKSLKESKNDMIEVTEVNPIFPWWVYDKHRKVFNDIIDMIWYKKKFDIFVPNTTSKELYFVNDDMTVICTEDNIQFVIHKVNKNTEFLTTLTYVGYYKSSVEIDGYVDKGYYGAFLEDFLNTLYHWK